ncbi:MAG: hypothetical protein AAF587_01705 [Bacteroidota bacterium]
MMKNTTFFSILGILCLVSIGCERPEINNSDNNYPLDISMTVEEDEVSLSWTRTNVSSFEGYVILRSPDSIPDDINILGPSPFFLGLIQELDETEFVDDEIPFAESLYYKVIANVGERMLISPTVRADFDRTILNFRFDQFFFNRANQKGYFIDNFSGQTNRYDFKDEKEESGLSFLGGISSMSFGDRDGGEIYTANQTNKLSILNEETLTEKTSITVSSSTSTGIYHSIYRGDLLFMTTRIWNSPFQVYRRSTRALVDQFTYQSPSEERTIAFLSDSANKMIAASRSHLDYLHLSESGAIVERKDLAHFEFSFLLPQPVVSPDGEYVIPYTSGRVFSTNPIQVIGSVGNFTSNATDFAFSEDGTKVFAIRSFPAQVEEYSFPNLQLLKTHRLGIFLKRIFVEGNDLVVLGNIHTSGFEQTVIERIDIE